MGRVPIKTQLHYTTIQTILKLSISHTFGLKKRKINLKLNQICALKCKQVLMRLQECTVYVREGAIIREGILISDKNGHLQVQLRVREESEVTYGLTDWMENLKQPSLMSHDDLNVRRLVAENGRIISAYKKYKMVSIFCKNMLRIPKSLDIFSSPSLLMNFFPLSWPVNN